MFKNTVDRGNRSFFWHSISTKLVRPKQANVPLFWPKPISVWAHAPTLSLARDHALLLAERYLIMLGGVLAGGVSLTLQKSIESSQESTTIELKRAVMPKRKAAQPTSREANSVGASSKRIAMARNSNSNANQEDVAPRRIKSPDLITLSDPPSDGEESDATVPGNVN